MSKEHTKSLNNAKIQKHQQQQQTQQISTEIKIYQTHLHILSNTHRHTHTYERHMHICKITATRNHKLSKDHRASVECKHKETHTEVHTRNYEQNNTTKSQQQQQQ